MVEVFSTSSAIIAYLDSTFLHFGLPKTITIDKWYLFTSKEFKAFLYKISRNDHDFIRPTIKWDG